MFTGIISGVGRILESLPIAEGPGGSDDHGRRLTLGTPPGYLDDVALGDSIAINGACMTVVAFDAAAARFAVEVSAESLDKTVGLAEPGPVNLEKAMRPQDRLGGHLVSGHVDGTGTVTRFEPTGESWTLVIAAPAALARFLAVKGSITVDGVSLTVNRVVDRAAADGLGCEFWINLIPHTVAHTTLGGLQPGRRVNLEIDQIARYVERMTQWERAAAAAAAAPAAAAA
ncbi:riboflavin synthase [Piscinibacter sakaiensis]|uniref:Riboflavin synthase n=1 Tax=Piscinibacter sakaiensis TaxID=1547922 RepID=A0A0K8P2J2_PISS1|nr:riboflavin synthase [Piscinibacter sakaiensis]GAP36892.1 riboflavin synthase eubacterial/eukaryotic [Piscinibacter sakaiensis]